MLIFYCQRRRENQCLVCQGKSLPSSGHISMFIMYLHSFLLVHTMQICNQARFNMFNSCQHGTFTECFILETQSSFYQHTITIVWQFAGKSQLWKLHSSAFRSSAMILKFIEMRSVSTLSRSTLPVLAVSNTLNAPLVQNTHCSYWRKESSRHFLGT